MELVVIVLYYVFYFWVLCLYFLAACWADAL